LLGRMYPKADYLPQIFRGKAFISNIARHPCDAYCFSVSAFHDDLKRDLLDPALASELGGYRTADLFREVYERAPADDHLSRIQYLDIKTYLCDDILTKVDRASMAVSLEVRCPILDHVFMEYAARIPWRSKLVGTKGKHIFKKALQRLLPDDILYRKKMGFGVPILEWLRNELKDYASRLVLEGEASTRLFRKATLQRMWGEHQRGTRNWATELWVVMMLNLWFEKFGTTRGDSRPAAAAAPGRGVLASECRLRCVSFTWSTASARAGWKRASRRSSVTHRPTSSTPSCAWRDPGHPRGCCPMKRRSSRWPNVKATRCCSCFDWPARCGRARRMWCTRATGADWTG